MRHVFSGTNVTPTKKPNVLTILQEHFWKRADRNPLGQVSSTQRHFIHCFDLYEYLVI
jgi:hypothetical protein